MTSLIIAGTSKGVGKTAFAGGLASAYAADGLAVELPNSSAKLQRITGSSASKSAKSVKLIESGENHKDNLKTAEKEKARVVLVASHNDNLQEAVKIYGKRLAGVVVNRVPLYQDHLADAVGAELKDKFLGWLPEETLLIAPTTDAVTEHLDGSYAYGEEYGERLIANFLIGGLVLDWGPFYFGSREGVGVLVRGDRPDVQLAALQTETVRALFLTKGVEPTEYVYYEATQNEIPLVKCALDTKDSADRLAQMAVDQPVEHPDKVVRMAELLKEHIKLDELKQTMPATVKH